MNDKAVYKKHMNDKAVYKYGMHGDRDQMGKKGPHQKMGEYFPQQSDYLTEDGRAIDASKQKAQMNEAGMQQKYKRVYEKSAAVQNESTPSTPKEDVVYSSWDSSGKGTSPTKINPSRTKEQIKELNVTSDAAKRSIMNTTASKESTSKTSASPDTRKSTYYVKGDDGNYSKKKKSFELAYRRAEGNETGKTTRTKKVYDRKGNLKKTVTATNDQKFKYNQIRRQSQRMTGKKKLNPAQARADDARIMDAQPRGKNPRFL